MVVSNTLEILSEFECCYAHHSVLLHKDDYLAVTVTHDTKNEWPRVTCAQFCGLGDDKSVHLHRPNYSVANS